MTELLLFKKINIYIYNTHTSGVKNTHTKKQTVLGLLYAVPTTVVGSYRPK